jgi:NADPH-dependent FMN reductase
MHKAIPQVRLVGLPGSLRKASFSRATLVGLRDNLPDKVTLDILDLQLPLYNEDDDHPDGPVDVQRFRDAIADCDGVMIATPEYNHGISGRSEERAGLGFTSLRKVRSHQQAGAGHICFAGLYRRGPCACPGQ